MIDIIIWVILIVICFLVTFLGCYTLGTCYPPLCSNHFLCCQQCKPQPTPTVRDGYAQAADGGDLESGQKGDSDYPTLAGVMTNPVAIVLRLACSLVTAYIIGIILVAILTTTYSPFPGIKASDCEATCGGGEDDTCCSYENPIGTIKDLIEDVSFQSGGVNMHGWWIPGSVAGKGTILYSHGSGSNVAGIYRQHRYAYLSQTLGFDVFVYDYPGYGKSEGEADEDSVIQSGRDAIAYLKSSRNVTESDIFLLGRSLGGTVTVRLAAEIDKAAGGPGTKGVVLQSTFKSYKGAAATGLPLLGWVASSVWPVDMGPPSDYAPDIKSCLHQFHSHGDELVTFSLASDLYDAIQTANPDCKKFVETDNDKHDAKMTDAEKTSLAAWFAAQA